MFIGWLFVLFVIGACFWSFGGVLLHRLERISARGLKHVVFWRSKCDHTGNTLRRFELIPILSYLIQWGTSRHSKQKLSSEYLWLEVLCGLIFVLTALLTHTHELRVLLYHIIFNRLLFLLARYDIKHQYLHTPVRAILVIWEVCMWVTHPQQSIIASLVFGLFFALIWILARRYAKIYYKHNEWFGSGDVLLALVLWASVPAIFDIYGVPFSIQTVVGTLVWFLTISSVLGLVYAALSYMWSRQKIVFIPFIPAMIVAYWILLYAGDSILRFILR